MAFTYWMYNCDKFNRTMDLEVSFIFHIYFSLCLWQKVTVGSKFISGIVVRISQMIDGLIWPVD